MESSSALDASSDYRYPILGPEDLNSESVAKRISIERMRVMGREEQRARARMKKHLQKTLKRAPTDEEIEEALRQLEQTKEKEGRGRFGRQKKRGRFD